MIDLLTSGAARPSGIIATTFTKRAAAALKARVRVSLLRKGMTAEANELKNALIGTVHGLGAVPYTHPPLPTTTIVYGDVSDEHVTKYSQSTAQ